MRVVELYSDGGVRNVLRGVYDTLQYDVIKPLSIWAKRTETLSVAGHTIRFAIENEESLSRAEGHGEIPVITDVAHTLDCGEVFWDVGSNQGTYTILAALCGAEPHAFEPARETVSVMEKNLRLNDVDATVHPIALSDERGEVALARTGRMGTRHLDRGSGGEPVPVRRGDSVNAPPPEVIKIDVEGDESAVLDGLRGRIDRCRVCYVEVHEGTDKSDIVSKLEGFGFGDVETFGRGRETILRAERQDTG